MTRDQVSHSSFRTIPDSGYERKRGEKRQGLGQPGDRQLIGEIRQAPAGPLVGHQEILQDGSQKSSFGLRFLRFPNDLFWVN
jgi:hypothetical protein